jgi:hypothetical protein
MNCDVWQWLGTAAFMYRVTNALLAHEIDEHHNEYLETLMRHFKTLFILFGPAVFFLADWIIPVRFLFR